MICAVISALLAALQKLKMQWSWAGMPDASWFWCPLFLGEESSATDLLYTLRKASLQVTSQFLPETSIFEQKVCNKRHLISKGDWDCRIFDRTYCVLGPIQATLCTLGSTETSHFKPLQAPLVHFKPLYQAGLKRGVNRQRVATFFLRPGWEYDDAATLHTGKRLSRTICSLQLLPRTWTDHFFHRLG